MITSSYYQSAMRIMYALLQRDITIYRHHALRSCMNYGIIYPIIFSLSFGLLLPSYGLGHQSALMTTMMVCGSFVWIVYPLTFHLMIDLLYDVRNKGITLYYLTIVPPALLLIERLIYSTLIVTISALPFFCMTRLMLGTLFDMSHASYTGIITMIVTSALFCTAFNIFMASWLTTDDQLTNFFVRIVMPLVNFGGFLVPWYAMNTLHPLLGLITLANPFTYVTEGLRAAVLGNSHFISVPWCAGALTGFTVLFMLLATYHFKHKTDSL